MIKLFFTLLFIIPIFAYAEEKYSLDLNGSFTEEIKVLSDGSTFATVLTNGAFTDNEGNYGKYSCNGIREANNQGILINLNVLCEILDKDLENIWLKARRYTSRAGGIGHYIIVDATGPHKKKIGLECTYAITSFKDIFLIKAICEK